MKLCNNCGGKEATHKQKTLCANCNVREWQKNNPEKVKASHAKYRLKNRDACNSRTTKWKIENPERYKQSQDDWFKNHKEEQRKKMREKYHENNPNAKRRVK